MDMDIKWMPLFIVLFMIALILVYLSLFHVLIGFIFASIIVFVARGKEDV